MPPVYVNVRCCHCRVPPSGVVTCVSSSVPPPYCMVCDTPREVLYRWMTALPGGTQNAWQFYRDDAGDASRPVHYWTILYDQGTATLKMWFSYPNTGPFYGLPWAYEEYNTHYTISFYKLLGWTQDAAGNVYIAGVFT